MKQTVGLLALLTAAALAVLSCKKGTETTGISPHANTELQQKIDAIGQRYVDGGKVLGLSIAVLRENDTLYAGGFGFTDTARTRAVNNNTNFLLASISKLVGTAMVMKLAEEGKLSLEQSLYELLPDYPDVEQAKKLKLRHLVSHTSGLPEYASVVDSIYVKTRIPPTKEQIYQILTENPPMFEPGEHYSYNNSGFYLMGLIIEHVTGRSFQSEMDRIINAPTGLHFKLIGEAVHEPEMSPLYELHGNRMVPEPHWTWIKGDGGMTTTALELANFPLMWSDGAIISDSSYQQMITPTPLNDGLETGYGLGVFTGIFEGHPVLGHSGGHKTLKSKMMFFPDQRLSIVVMVNTDNTPANANRIFGEVALAALDLKIPDYSAVNEVIPEPNRYEGSYQEEAVKEHNTVEITYNTEDSHLYYGFAGSGGRPEKMHHLGDGEFWVEDWPLDRIYFVYGEDGRILALREYYTGYYTHLRKKAD